MISFLDNTNQESEFNRNNGFITADVSVIFVMSHSSIIAYILM